MIKVRRDVVAPPDVLEADGELGDQERQYNAQAKANGEKLRFNVYKHDAVRVALEHVFGRKCCYCESLIAGTQPGDVEHYRPKARIAVHDLARTSVTYKDGYYWLASRWSNLLISCADCNRPRTQDDGDDVARVIGKANFFPLGDEALRASAADAVAGEAALLLDPCVDDPVMHLRFTDEGGIEVGEQDGQPSEKGEATIYYCGLARAELFQMRSRHRRSVMLAIRATLRALEAGEDPGEDLDALVAMLQPGEAYVAYTRQLVRRYMEPQIEQLGLEL
ncbi:MAG TPA: hypothetical protein VF169_11280 [Albitalea sp.]|uniref:hypothetical protein n=1 Tax=Piscinibacter sp. TaxID=1903157 RepID=UPI002ED27748